tara:strand:+ start:48 stop:227 length:180 start_codon:yes stop_codon:yes gene_type:complete
MKNFKKGDQVKLKDSGNIRYAIVTKDGVDSQGRVRVKPDGFPFDMSITTNSNDKVFVIT